MEEWFGYFIEVNIQNILTSVNAFNYDLDVRPGHKEGVIKDEFYLVSHYWDGNVCVRVQVLLQVCS
jgi:hypothetical protein